MLSHGRYVLSFERNGVRQERDVVVVQASLLTLDERRKSCIHGASWDGVLVYRFVGADGTPLDASSWMRADLVPECNFAKSDCETIVWRNPSLGDLPDAELIVIVESPESSEPIWLGYCDWDGDHQFWRWIDGTRIETEVTGWAEMPVGRFRREAACVGD
jgi:hypothetical protein